MWPTNRVWSPQSCWDTMSAAIVAAAPVKSGARPTRTNCGARSATGPPEKCVESFSWSLARVLTPQKRTSTRQGWMRAGLPTETTHSGGSSEPDMKAFAVMPRISPCTSVVITVTPVANAPITLRNSAGLIARGFSLIFSLLMCGVYPIQKVRTTCASTLERSGSADGELALGAAGLGGLSHHALHILPKCGQEANKLIAREAVEVTAHQLGNLRLVNAECLCCPFLGQLPCPEDRRDADRKLGLEQHLLRVLQTQIGEDVATAGRRR